MGLILGIGIFLMIISFIILVTVLMASWVISSGCWYAVIALIVVLPLIEWIIIRSNNKKKNKMSKKDQSTYNRIIRSEDEKFRSAQNEYERKLAQYNADLKRCEEERAEKIVRNRQAFERDLPTMEENLRQAENAYAAAWAAYENDDTLDRSDKPSLDQLIDLIARKRANSITEALNYLDNKREKDKDRAAQAAREAEIEALKKKFEQERDYLLRREESEYREQQREKHRQEMDRLRIQGDINTIKNRLNLDD